MILSFLLALVINSYSQQILWGVTIFGGDNDDGVIFKYDLSSSTFTKLHDFAIDDTLNGGNPYCSLVRDNNGILFGTTAYGGTNNKGVLYSFDPDSCKYKVVYSFNDSTGTPFIHGIMDNRNYDILLVNDSLIYGVLYKSATTNIFEFNTIQNQLTKLIQIPDDIFQWHIPGLIKKGSLLYGISHKWIFSFNYITNDFKKIIKPPNFLGVFSKLYLASNSKIYFTDHSGGGLEWGSLLEYDSVNDVVNKLHDFEIILEPDPTVSELKNGTLIGVANYGIYTYNIDNNNYEIQFVSWDFSPVSSLTINSSDEAFGMCRLSKNNSEDLDYGEIYKYSVSNNSYTVLFNFDSINGRSPGSCSLILTGDILGTTDNSYTQNKVKVFPNPASDEFSINIKNLTKSELSIYNLNGEIIIQKTITSIDKIVDINHLTSGIYLIQIETGNETYYSRFMKK